MRGGISRARPQTTGKGQQLDCAAMAAWTRRPAPEGLTSLPWWTTSLPRWIAGLGLGWGCRGSGRRPSGAGGPGRLTDADDGEHDDEGVDDRAEGPGQRRDDLAHRLDLAEEPARARAARRRFYLLGWDAPLPPKRKT